MLSRLIKHFKISSFFRPFKFPSIVTHKNDRIEHTPQRKLVAWEYCPKKVEVFVGISALKKKRSKIHGKEYPISRMVFSNLNG